MSLNYIIIYNYNYDYPLEIPTPCQKCGRIFELNCGVRSEKWFPDTTICVECGIEEDNEIEDDEIIENANNQLNDALFDLEKHGWDRFTDENRELLIDFLKTYIEVRDGENPSSMDLEILERFKI